MLRMLWNLVLHSASEALPATFLVDVVVYMSWSCSRAAGSIDANCGIGLEWHRGNSATTCLRMFSKGAASSTTT